MSEQNINGKIAFLRDTYLDAEKDYLAELKQDPKFVDLLLKLKKCKPQALYDQAIKWISEIEEGKVAEKNLDRYEAQIALFLDAIDDLQRDTNRERVRQDYDLVR